MRYISTRGKAPVLDFEGVLLSGLAPDGGLYLPESWPMLEPETIAGFAGRPYAEVAAAVIAPFVGEALDESSLCQLAQQTYEETFAHAATAPLKQLDSRLFLLELFHGPTLAFKDFALQFLGRLFDHVLARRGERITIVGATSGDTGSAAIEACRDRSAVDIFILHPKGRVSEVQRRQMTTVDAPNVHNIALEGSFDDCQDLVKALFADAAFRKEQKLSAVNSINWARIMAQIVYYFVAAVALGAPRREIAFAVPTGNFGNVFAGYAARAMGLPIAHLAVGSNANDILTRFFENGRMQLGEVIATHSPSMDIQVSSNFERLLFDLSGRDGNKVTAQMTRLRESGGFEVEPAALAEALRLFSGFRLNDSATLKEVAYWHRHSGEIIDPHSVVGIAAARAAPIAREIPIVALATAHPAKFPDAVELACGERPELPERLVDLYARKESYEVLPRDLEKLKAHIRARVKLQGAA